MPEDRRLIGVCLCTIHREDRYNFISELNPIAVEHGYRLLVFNACTDLYEHDNPNSAGERAVFRMIPYEQLAAMIIFPHFLYKNPSMDTVIADCKAHNLPVLSIDCETEGCYNFSFTYEDIFERLCAHVIDDHHVKSVLMMAGIKDNVFSDQRIAAFRKVLEERNMYYDDSLIGYGNFWDMPTEGVMQEWFEEEGREYPEAIICANDSMAIAVSTYLQNHGVRVPEDCIVTGFDGILQADYHMPHLTTCRQDYALMGQKIIEAIDLLAAGKPAPEKTTVGFTMHLSQSCGCEPTGFVNINAATDVLFKGMRLAEYRQEMMCMLQAEIAKMSSMEELSAVLNDKFVFPTIVFAINNDIFEPPYFGRNHIDGPPFTDTVTIQYQRYFWYQMESCSLPRSEIVPHMERLWERTEPIVVCGLHLLELPLGYCVFQPEMIVDDYQKMYIFMNAINASFGTFHKQFQIQAINQKLQEVNEELDQLYVHDYLTGLYNRRGFYREFRRQFEVQKGLEMQAVLVSADLDRLKKINDQYGHQEGDSAIITTAKALQHAAGEGDICARFGGDEFAVGAFLPAALTEAYTERFRTMCEEYLAAYNQSSGKPYPVEMSIGFTVADADDQFDLDRMIKEADERMYADKLAHNKTRES